MTYLKNINSSADLKKLEVSQLPDLADEIRHAILNRVSKTGGHVGPNLGMVEMTLALHYVFNSPTDKIVYDVSHQCYAHKILTGRKEAFLDENKFSTVSGFTNPSESEHDFFTIGHTSTGISLACGLAKARDLKKEKGNVIAIVGDGSLGGGEALEALNYVAELKGNLIVVVNDNDMSIAENHGGLYSNLKQLRDTNGQSANNMFKAWGLDYVYLDKGNDIPALIEVLKQVKDRRMPVVLHVKTEKGHGYAPAVSEKEKWHFNGPFDIETGQNIRSLNGRDLNAITADFLLEKMAKDEKVVVLNAGTPGAIAFTPERRRQAGKQFIDVGIAEEHAVAMASALAKDGCKPVFWVLSSFSQRVYDQLSHDLALNNSPAVILVSWSGISGADKTHLGCFDMAMMSSIPNIRLLAPTSIEEALNVLDWAIEQTEGPVVIRMPFFLPNEDKKSFQNIHFYDIAEKGNTVAILGLGAFFDLGKKVVDLLKKEGFSPTLINPLLVDTNENVLEGLKKDHQIVVTLEDGVLNGGFGEKIARFYASSSMKVLTYGAEKDFPDRVPVFKLYERYRLTEKQILADILTILKA